MTRSDVVYELLEAADPVGTVESLDSSAVVARVEAELGYGTGTEPVTDAPIRRGGRSAVTMRSREWRRPAWAASIAFAATVAVLGTSMVLGVVLHHPGFDTAARWIPDGLRGAAASASVGSVLVPTVALVVAVITALIVRNRVKEKAMATTIDTAPAEQLASARRNNRWLVGAVIVVTVLLLALSAWVVYDLASEPETAATDEVTALYDDYVKAYVEGDTEAFFALTTEDYLFKAVGDYAVDRNTQANVAVRPGFQIERVGDLMMTGDGPTYFVVATEQALDGSYPGVSAYRIVQTEDGLKIAEHTWVSDL